MIKEIQVAARMGGGEIDSNPRLRLAVEKAYDANMPKDNINRAIQRGVGGVDGANYEEIRYEGYGIGGAAVKPAKDVRVGDLVTVEIERIVWEVQVLGMCEVRGPASVAQTLYAETPDSRAKREVEAERRRTFREPAAGLQGRPTKRDRRIIDKLSGGE
ncbi:hypothetical protein FCO27_19330 [Bacillus pumilus]|nr:hypothetical protein FCO27_19330 [Bacillus pumilus]